MKKNKIQEILSNFVYEIGDHYVYKLKNKNGYNILRKELTCTVVCAFVGNYPHEDGIRRAIKEANKREKYRIKCL